MKYGRRLFIPLLIFLLCFESKSQESKIRIAILDLEVAGFDSSVVIGLSNRLRAELVETGQFDVMERNRMSEILFEQGFQQTGTCNSDECIIQAGKILSVAKMVVGSVSRVNSLFTVTLRMIDVETASIEFFVTEDSPGEIETVLTTSLKNIARKFVARLNPMAFLTLNASPGNSQIFIDDALVGVSPFDSLRVQPDVHRIRVQKNDYIPYTEEFTFQSGKETVINVNLSPAATLFVQSEPAEAELFLDGTFKGVTPLTVPNLNPGLTKIKLQHRQFQPYVSEIVLEGGKTERLDIKLSSRFGALRVESVPSGATVEIDGSAKGETPLEANGIPFGKHLLRLSKEGFRSVEEEFEISSEVFQTRKINLKIGHGTLYLYPEPNDTRIFLDSEFLDQIPVEGIQLFPGEYQILAERPGYEKMTTRVQIKPNESFSLKLDLNEKTKSKAVFRSLIFPGLGQQYAGKKFRLRAFLILEIVSLGGIVISEMTRSNKIDLYNESREEYLAAINESNIENSRFQMERDYHSIQNAGDQRNLFITAAAAVWLFNILDSCIFPPIRPLHFSSQLKKTNFQLSVEMQQKQWYVNLNHTF